MPTIEPFHAICIDHYMRHGFQYFGVGYLRAAETAVNMPTLFDFMNKEDEPA